MLFKATSSVEFQREIHAEPGGSFMLKEWGTIKVGPGSETGGKSGECSVLEAK